MWELCNLVVSLAIIAAIVYGLSKLLRVKPIVPSIPNPRRSSVVAIGVLLVMLMAAVFFVLVLSCVTGKSFRPRDVATQFEPSHLLIALVVIPIYLLPALIVTIRRRESFESIGITARNLWQSTIIGFIISAMIVCLDSNKLQKLPLIGMCHIIALGFYAVVGFGEEFLFRGFLQNRLMAWLGAWRGVLLTAVVFTMFHMPQQLIVGFSWTQVLISTGNYIPISLFLGFVMLRTGNLMAIGLFHTFANWINVLKNIP
jgi:membrane protease YdiL (CAAX protease family)